MQDLQYYRKYCKYKQKYNNLVQHGGDPLNNINNNIYLKFITEKLVSPSVLPSVPVTVVPTVVIVTKKRGSSLSVSEAEAELVSKYPQRAMIKSVLLKDYVEDLTPAILRYLSPISRSRMEADIVIDDKVIERLATIQEKEDEEYVNYENRGKQIEVWIANNMLCPCCHKANSLRRYLSDSMPVIDLVCINPEHTLDHGVKFFQVKVSNGSLFMDKPYFNYDVLSTTDANTIHVGSRVWGEPVHAITPYDSPLDKKILCGYICIRYIDRETDSVLRIDCANSMIVLPQYLLSARKKLMFGVTYPLFDDSMQWYYRYIDETISVSASGSKKHNRIRFNLETNTVLRGDTIRALIPSTTIDKSYPIGGVPMDNPLSIIE
jgi:hypothetical protein